MPITQELNRKIPWNGNRISTVSTWQQRTTHIPTKLYQDRFKSYTQIGLAVHWIGSGMLSFYWKKGFIFLSLSHKWFFCLNSTLLSSRKKTHTLTVMVFLSGSKADPSICQSSGPWITNGFWGQRWARVWGWFTTGWNQLQWYVRILWLLWVTGASCMKSLFPKGPKSTFHSSEKIAIL